MNRLTNVRSSAAEVVLGAVGCVAYFTCVLHCVQEYIADFALCTGPSMEPTIYSQSVVLSEHLSVSQNKIKRGDIVISKSPSNPEMHICKRVKGIAGDKIRTKFSSEIVPKGHVWLEGDNKDNSCDSRNYGPVPKGLIRGRVIFLVWPLASIGRLTKVAEKST